MKTRIKLLVTALFVVAVGIIFVVSRVIPNYFMIKSDFSDATLSEKRMIEEFYHFYPETISYGEIFDIKLISGDPVFASANKFGNYRITGSGVVYSIVKKVKGELEFVVYIEADFTNGKTMLVLDSGFGGKFNQEKLGRIGLPKGNKYILPCSGLSFPVLFADSVQDDGIYQLVEVRVRFLYGIGSNKTEEIHVLKPNPTLQKEMAISLIGSFFNDTKDDLACRKYIYLNILTYMETLIKTDFARWNEIVTEYVRMYEENNSTFEAIILKDLGPHLLTFSTESEWKHLLIEDELQRYFEIRNWIGENLREGFDFD